MTIVGIYVRFLHRYIFITTILSYADTYTSIFSDSSLGSSAFVGAPALSG